MASSSPSSSANRILPSLIVFDLDDCLWSPEMHELAGLPEIPIHGDYTHPNVDKTKTSPKINVVIGLQVPGFGGRRSQNRYSHAGDTVKLFDGARWVLYELATNPIYSNLQLATASSSLEPNYAFACLDNIEILPHKTLGDMMVCNQIGRSGKLSPNKVSHFKEIHKSTGIPYEEMLFFDDCNWGDHCANVSKTLGVCSWRTPQGLQYTDFQQALEKFHHTQSSNQKQQSIKLRK